MPLLSPAGGHSSQGTAQLSPADTKLCSLSSTRPIQPLCFPAFKERGGLGSLAGCQVTAIDAEGTTL